jgi:hypothetical protein
MRSSRHGLLSKSAGEVQTDGQKAALLENHTALLYLIDKWRQIQAVYMPGVLNIDTTDPKSPQRVKAKSIILWLPSKLDAKDRNTICMGSVINNEMELRLAQLEDSLNDLRRARRTRRGLILFHKVQLAGQGQKIQTKSQAAMRAIQDRIDRYVRRYRVARDALLCLNAPGEWRELYRPLTNNDNRGPGKEQEEVLGSDSILCSFMDLALHHNGNHSRRSQRGYVRRVGSMHGSRRPLGGGEDPSAGGDEVGCRVSCMAVRRLARQSGLEDRHYACGSFWALGICEQTRHYLPPPRHLVLSTLVFNARLPFAPSQLGHQVPGCTQGTTQRPRPQEEKAD